MPVSYVLPSFFWWWDFAIEILHLNLNRQNKMKTQIGAQCPNWRSHFYLYIPDYCIDITKSQRTLHSGLQI